MKQIKICYNQLYKNDLRFVISKKFPNGQLALYEGVPNYKTGIPSTKYVMLKAYYEEARCEWCGELYLKPIRFKHNICSNECKQALCLWNKEWKLKVSVQKKQKKKIKVKKVVKIKQNKRYFELLEKGKLHPLYKNNTILLPYYPLRRATDDPDYIEAKCAYCGKWFKPSKDQLTRVRAFIKGKEYKKTISNFYCCSKHALLLRQELSQLKKDWRANKKKEAILIKQIEQEKKKNKELLLKQQELQKRKEKKEQQAKLKEQKKIERIKNRKMPIDPEERKLYEIKRNKNQREQLRIEQPKEFKLRRLLYYSRVRAKEKNIPNTITKEWLYKKTKENLCELTKIPFDYNTTIQRNPFGPSIDRIDITKGYTPENCRVILWAVNAGLGHYTEKDLYIICKAYLEYNNIV